MAISGNLPQHLVVAARTGVIASQAKMDMPYRRVASEIDLTAKSTNFVDLGGMPAPTNNPKVVNSRIEKSKTVEPQDWYLTLSISQNALDDDQTGSLERQFKDILPAFQRHINSRVFTVLNAGDATTYGTTLDGGAFFANSHVWPGAAYTTGQDNLAGLSLSGTNFNTAWVTARAFGDDHGNFLNYNYNLLVVHPTGNKIAAEITGNPEDYETANRATNPYKGTNYITAPELDTTAAILIAENESVKPLFVAIRKRPALHNMWFDSLQDDGGMHYFQYHGRYTVDYADWTSAIMIAT